MRIVTAILLILSLTVPLCSCTGLKSVAPDIQTEMQDEQTDADEAPVPGYDANDIDYSEQTDRKRAPDESRITINGRTFTIEEIIEGVMDTFNCQMYLYGNDPTSDNILCNKELILHQDIEYELCYRPPGPYSLYGRIIVMMPNMLHPYSTDENPRVYFFGIFISEIGLESDFSLGDSCPQNISLSTESGEDIYLGSYTIRIDEVTRPPFEVMDTEWVENTENAIRLYMDGDYHAELGIKHDLEPGNYLAYVQPFFRADVRGYIIFEHENGNVYWGWYDWVHDDIGDYPASLNHVELAYNPNDASFLSYLEKVRSDSQVNLEYSVKERG